MDKKIVIFFSFLVIFVVTTISIVSQKNSSEAIKVSQVSQNEFWESTNRADRIINLRKKHRGHNNTYRENRRDNSFSQSYQEQQTIVNVNLSDLDKPHFLRISGSSREIQLTAEISLNDRLLTSFTKNHNMLDLSPYLTLGKQRVSISGNYTPSNASVKIEFSGQTTHISQETGGTGELRQQLIFNVQ